MDDVHVDAEDVGLEVAADCGLPVAPVLVVVADSEVVDAAVPTWPSLSNLLRGQNGAAPVSVVSLTGSPFQGW